MGRGLSYEGYTGTCWRPTSLMSRGGCYWLTNADWLISLPAAQILPGLLRERVRMAKIKETERVRIPSVPAFFFCKSREAWRKCMREALSASHSGESTSGRRPPPRRVAPRDRGRTSPYSPEITGGTYIYSLAGLLEIRCLFQGSTLLIYPLYSNAGSFHYD